MTPASDPALGFFLGYVEAEGALVEETGGVALLVAPAELQARLGIGEVCSVTAAPDAAREEGALLVVPGHPLLDRAAEAVLGRGDGGLAHLPWPATRPGRAALIERARETVFVDHGRLDPVGEPAAVHTPMLRVGALLTYTLSLTHRVQEREEVWVDGASGLLLPEGLRSVLEAAEPAPGADPGRPALRFDVSPALQRAVSELDARAGARRRELAGEAREDLHDELSRAAGFYDAALASLERRRAQAPAERREMFEARAESTRAERARRLAEIEEKFRPAHDVRPYRLHLLFVPTLVVPVEVRRGERRYPLGLRWLIPTASFAPLPCPHCGASAPLVAGRERLGCRSCLPRAVPAASPGRPSAPDGRPHAPDPPARSHPPAGAIPPPGGTASPGAAAPPAPGSLNGAPRRPPPEQPSGSAARPDPEQLALLLPGSDGSSANRPSGPLPAPPPRGDGPSPRPDGPSPRAAPAARPGSGQRPRNPRGGPSAGRVAPPGRDQAGPDPRQVERAGARLAVELWETVGSDGRRPRRAVAPHSPLAVLDGLYGGQAPAVAAGIPAGRPLLRVTSVTAALLPGFLHATTGVVDAAGRTYPYTLRWYLEGSRAVVAEVLPWPRVLFNQLPPTADLAPDVASALGTHLPPPRLPRDPVAAALWAADRARVGLPILARCLAAWGRLPEPPGSPEHPPAALAAALVYQVGRRAGRRVSVEEEAAAHGVERAGVERASRLLQRRLRLSANVAW